MTTQLTLDIALAEAGRDAGIKQAVSHANAVTPDWSEKAYSMFKEWLSGWASGHTFQIEDFRLSAQIRGLPDPPSARAFGGLARKANKAGLITSNGPKPTRSVSAHSCYANEWQKV